MFFFGGDTIESKLHCNEKTKVQRACVLIALLWFLGQVMGGPRTVEQAGGSTGGTGSTMASGFSQGQLYSGQSNNAAFCTVPLGGTLEQSEMGRTLTSLGLHEESAETDCLLPSYSPTSSIVLVPSRPRSDPSSDCQ